MQDYAMEDNCIEAPCNTFPSQITGPSGEQVYWAPVGSYYPVYPEGIDKELANKLFNKAALAWAELVCCIDDENVIKAARKSEKGMEIFKRKSYGNATPFISISHMPLNEEYFEINYFVCYFTSKPHKLEENKYFTVGVIGP